MSDAVRIIRFEFDKVEIMYRTRAWNDERAKRAAMYIGRGIGLQKVHGDCCLITAGTRRFEQTIVHIRGFIK